MVNNDKSREKVLVDYEEKMSLEKAATLLESIAKKLREEGTFSLTHGNETHEITPSKNVEFEIKYEVKEKKHEIEFELEWVEGQEQTGNLEIN